MSNTIENIYSEAPQRKGFSINTAITSVILNTGQGYSQLEEFCGIQYTIYMICICHFLLFNIFMKKLVNVYLV
jgi:hypothetical protein